MTGLGPDSPGTSSTTFPPALANLQTAAQDALRHLPGAVALHAFGSLVAGTPDAFSDIDLELVTTDLEATLRARYVVFERIGPVRLEWRIHPSRSDWAATLLFEGISPYHKLDIGFTACASDGQGMVLPGGRLLWRQNPPLISPGSATHLPYAPAAGTLPHWVLGHLLGITRYVKARKRGQDLMCWRTRRS